MSDSQVMLVTGCASGIGKQLATDLFALGHRLILTDVAEQALADVVERLDGSQRSDRIELAVLDVRDSAAWERVLERCIARFERIDVVCNVAGCLEAAWVHEVTEKAVQMMIDVNVKGVIHGTRLAARRMVLQRSGHIVNIASMAGIATVPGNAVYCASKHAVRGFSLSAGIELREHGVYVTAVCPGAVATPMLDIQFDREEAALTFSSRRALTPREVSRAVIERALVKKPLELVLPAGPGQGFVSRLSNLFPSLGLTLAATARKASRANQERLRQERAAEPSVGPAPTRSPDRHEPARDD